MRKLLLMVMILLLATMVVAAQAQYGPDAGTPGYQQLYQGSTSGPQGEKGNKGDRGSRGTRGLRGPQGPQGPAGKSYFFVDQNGRLQKSANKALQDAGYQTEGQLTQKFDKRYIKRDEVPVATAPAPVAGSVAVAVAPQVAEGGSDMSWAWGLAALALVIAAIMVPAWFIAQSHNWRLVRETEAGERARAQERIDLRKEELKNAQKLIAGAAHLTDRQPNTESMSAWVTSDSVVVRVNPVEHNGSTRRRKRRPEMPAEEPAA